MTATPASRRSRLLARRVVVVLVALTCVASLPPGSPVRHPPAAGDRDPHLAAAVSGPSLSPSAARAAAGPPPSVPASGTGWFLVPSNPAPSARGTPGMTYDLATQSVLLFGGGWNLGSGTNDTWSFHGGSWTNLTPSLPSAPTPREDPALAYDVADNEAILFGGYSNYLAPPGSSYMVDDTWGYAGGGWTSLTSSAGNAPPARLYPAFVYDPADAEIVLFGGQDLLSGVSYSDTWAFSHGAWQDLTGVVGVAPSGRGSAAAAYDSSTGSVILYGGYDARTQTYFGDTWSFSGNRWTQLFPSGQPPLVRGASLAPMDGGGLALAAGVDATVRPNQHTWAFTGTSWGELTASLNGTPPGVWFAGMVPDPADGVAVLFGGCLVLGCTASSGQTWELGAVAPPSSPPWYAFLGSESELLLIGELGLAFAIGLAAGAVVFRRRPPR